MELSAKIADCGHVQFIEMVLPMTRNVGNSDQSMFFIIRSRASGLKEISCCSQIPTLILTTPLCQSRLGVGLSAAIQVASDTQAMLRSFSS